MMHKLKKLSVLLGALLLVSLISGSTPIFAQKHKLEQARADPGRVPAEGRQSKNIELVGQIGGPTNAVAVQGKYAYLGIGPRLAILDVSDPARPSVVGRSSILPDIMSGIAVSDNYAYIAFGPYSGPGSSGLRIVNVADPTRPVDAGTFQTPRRALSVAVSGSFAYVADEDLHVVNVANPEKPTEVSTYHTAGRIQSVTVAGDYAYVADGDLRIVDVSNPREPAEVRRYITPQNSKAVAVSGRFAYVIDGPGPTGETDVLRIMDVSNWDFPTEIGSYKAPRAGGGGLGAAGNYVYFDAGGLRVISIADPARPVEVGSEGSVAAVGPIAISGKHAYLASSGTEPGKRSGLQIVGISDPAHPLRIGSYDPPREPIAIKVIGNNIYATDGYAGFKILDASKPANPVAVGQSRAAEHAGSLSLVGNYAYVGDGPTIKLQIIDISDPSSPSKVGSYPGIGSTVTLVGSYGYVTDVNGRIHILDVSNPTNPLDVGSFSLPGRVQGIALAGELAYVTVSGEGLRILNISNPLRPVEVGFYQAPWVPWETVVSGNYAYISAGAAGLHIIDVSNPANPVEISSYDAAGPAFGISISGNYLYVASSGKGLRAIDVSNPSKPVEVGSYDILGAVSRVVAAGNYVYVTGVSSGLWIFRTVGVSDWDITGGHFYTQARGDARSGLGYAVTDDAVAPFWSEFRRLGGVNAVGYPISRRFVWNGFVSQAFQKAVLQWRPEVGQVYSVNLFDEFSNQGKDGWLETVRSTPRPTRFDEAGLNWEQVIESRLQLLDSYPELRSAYLSVGDWLNLNGLPTAPVADYGNVRVLRAQRVVIQQWMVDVPWAAAGQVVFANGGDVAKEANLFPRESMEPEDPSAYAAPAVR